MSVLLLDKVMNIFLHKPAYECNIFKMWVRILEKYCPNGKVTLFESVSTLYTLEKNQDEFISDYMSRALRLFSGLHGINFNTMTNIFIIVDYDRYHFGALADCF